MSDRIPPRQSAQFEPDIQDAIEDMGYPRGTHFDDMGIPYFPKQQDNEQVSPELKITTNELSEKLRQFVNIDKEVKEIESQQTHKKLLGGITETKGPKVPNELWFKRMELLTFFLGNETHFKNTPSLRDIYQQFEEYYRKK